MLNFSVLRKSNLFMFNFNTFGGENVITKWQGIFYFNMPIVMNPGPARRKLIIVNQFPNSVVKYFEHDALDTIR